MFALRRSSVGGGGDAYEEAFDLEAEEFDEAFKQYLIERFEPFEEKEQPSDYGRNLAPDPLRSRYPVLISIEASPSGEVIAAAAPSTARTASSTSCSSRRAPARSSAT